MGEVPLNYELQTMAAIQRIIYNWPYVSFLVQNICELAMSKVPHALSMLV